jgi:uncharacterized HAD superfamily protein
MKTVSVQICTESDFTEWQDLTQKKLTEMLKLNAHVRCAATHRQPEHILFEATSSGSSHRNLSEKNPVEHL